MAPRPKSGDIVTARTAGGRTVTGFMRNRTTVDVPGMGGLSFVKVSGIKKASPKKARDTVSGMNVMSTRAAKIRKKADPRGTKLTRTRARRGAKGRGVKVRGLVARFNSALHPRDKRGRFVKK